MVVAEKKYSYDYGHLEQEWEREIEQRPIRRSKPSNKPKVLPMLLILLSFVAMNMALVAKSANIATANIELSNLNSQLKTVESEKSALQLQVAKLKSVERIQTIAKEEIQMIYANEAPSLRLQGKTGQIQEQWVTEEGTIGTLQTSPEPKLVWGELFLNWVQEKMNVSNYFQG